MEEERQPAPTSAFIPRDPGCYQSTDLTRGPWNPEHQHAGPSSALVAQEILRAAAPLGFTHMARLTASLFRPIPIGDLKIIVDTAYAGKNAGHFGAQLFAGAKEIARFSALLQREAVVTLPARGDDQTEAASPRSPAESHPAEFPFSKRWTGYPDLVEIRVARGEYFAGPCAAWFRLRRPLIAGRAPSPIERVAVAADSGNGISAVLDFKRFLFMNNDLSINLFRQPQGEWICIDARTELGSMGCGLAESRIYDSEGLIGRSTQSLMVRMRESAD